MKQETIELRKLTTDSGKVLTNGQDYGTEIYLGKGDSPENWQEIPKEEYEAILAQQDKEAYPWTIR